MTGDGGYSRKDFLRGLPANVTVVGRFLTSSKLYHQPKSSRQGKRGRKPRKGRLIGTPKGFIRNPQEFRPHPTEKGTLIREAVGIWHSVLPGVVIRVVVVWRRDYFKHHPQSKKPELEAFFTTDLTLSVREILSEVDGWWSIEIDLRDAQAYYGLGQDHCRQYKRIVGINSFRMLLAAARTLFFLSITEKAESFDLCSYRPWYKQKSAPGQLDVFWLCQQVLFHEGISPTVRFLQDVNEIDQNPNIALRKAA